MPSRMEVLRERAKPSRGSVEHQQLKGALRGVEPGPEHPLYEDYIRLTDPKPMGRPVADEVARGERPRAGTPEYNNWWRGNTEAGQLMYKRQKERQVDEYHGGGYGSGARLRARQRRVQQAKDFYGIDDHAAAEELADQYPTGNFPSPLTTHQYQEEGKTRWWPTELSPVGDRVREEPVPDVHGVRVSSVWQSLTVESSWEAQAAAKRKPAKPKVRKPEEVWYDVHKHPSGTPGGMGKSPEHHLRNRGWNGHEINEGSGKKTMQYMNHDFPDFVISFGGGSSTKPDHNFRVLYIGTNSNIPKITRAYSVAEAMNKVEELQKLEGGMIVQPMTHDAAAAVQPSTQKPVKPRNPKDVASDGLPDMNLDNAFPIGPPPKDFPSTPDKESDWRVPTKPKEPEKKPVVWGDTWKKPVKASWER